MANSSRHPDLRENLCSGRLVLSRLLPLALCLLLGWPHALGAQAPGGEQIRARIQSSGLSADEIRSRLASAGYSRSLLDAYLKGSEPAPEPSQDILAALSALTPVEVRAQGVVATPPDTGIAQAPRASDDGRADGKRIFGLDVFRSRSSQFQPLLAGPVPDTYRLGAGDLLVLVISGEVELVHNLEVTRDGFVLVPQVGQLYVSNLTMSQLKQVLRTRLGNAYSGIRTGSTQFDLTIARLRTNQVFVVGEVVQPGAYQLASVATVLNALYAAGGPTERGGMRQVKVERQGQTVATFDLYDYLLRGDTKADVTLEMGDVVFVPVHGVRASIGGEVVRPAVYELAPGQTLADLVAAAGGFAPEAALQRISILRILPVTARVPGAPDRVVLDVPAEQVVGGRVPPVAVEPGDEIMVFQVPPSQRSFVRLYGSVYRPGTFGWRPGIKLSEVVGLAGGVKPAVLSQIAHIQRLNVADSTRFVVRASIPPDSATPWTEDQVLQEYDEITIYGREQLRQPRDVWVAGMVGRPGEYPYSEGMTLRDVLLQAGGLRDGAFLDSVEIARLPRDRKSGQLAETFRVPLDSSYLFEPAGSSYRYLPGPPVRTSRLGEIILEPFDRVTIFRQPDWDLHRMVRVEGEVLYAGSFALEYRGERLSSVIRRAGGVSAAAFVDGARLMREADQSGAVNIDLAASLSRPGGSDDLILRPGDVITVPEYNAVVKVQGAVIAPASVQYRPGQGLDYYIANAGGYDRNADKGRVYVRSANGTGETTDGWWFTRRSPKVLPGAVVTVPTKPDEEPFRLTEFLAATASVLASTVAIIVIASR